LPFQVFHRLLKFASRLPPAEAGSETETKDLNAGLKASSTRARPGNRVFQQPVQSCCTRPCFVLSSRPRASARMDGPAVGPRL